MPSKNCPPEKVLSLKNRCVKKDGRVGREVLGLIQQRPAKNKRRVQKNRQP